MTNGKKEFVRITNADVYNLVVSIDKKIYKQRGTLLWHTWAIGTLLALILAIITRIF